MAYLKWGFLGICALLVGAFLHYTLPQHDIVRIVGTENRRIDFDGNSFFWASSGPAGAVNRDVFFVQAQRPEGGPIVYRNEDTGWGWPPYFKFDSSSLQAEAASLISTKADPIWVAVRHYGWRNQWLSIFPNATSLKVVSGPEARIIPWMSLFILLVLALGLGTLRVLWRRFRAQSIDPMLADMGETWEDVEDRADAAGRRGRGLWQRMMGRLKGR